MAHSLSAKKRIKQNAKRKRINRTRKSHVKAQTKRFEEALSEGNSEAATKQFRLVVKRLDQTAAGSTMHKRTAARKKSRLAKRLNKLVATRKGEHS